MILSSSNSDPGARVVTNVVTFGSSAHGVTHFVGPDILGTAISGARLLPVGVALHPGVQLRHPIDRQPRSIVARVVNSGSKRLAGVTLVVQVDRRTYVRTIGELAPDQWASVTIPLPGTLPKRYTIRIHTRPVEGERNLTNNSGSWRIAVRE